MLTSLREDEPRLLKERQAAARIELWRRQSKGDALRLAEVVLKDDTGKRLQVEELQRMWWRHISWCWSRGKTPWIFAPWGHGKSTLLTVAIPLWWLGNVSRNARIKIVSNADDNAKQRVMAIRRVIESDARYRLMYPQVRRDASLPWTQHEIYLDREGGVILSDPSLQAKGVFATGIAGRANLLVFDDVCDLKNTIQEPALKQKVCDEVDNTWLSRLEPDGRIFGVCTAWATDDANARMSKKKDTVTLMQMVREDLTCVDCEIVGEDLDGYPMPMAA